MLAMKLDIGYNRKLFAYQMTNIFLRYVRNVNLNANCGQIANCKLQTVNHMRHIERGECISNLEYLLVALMREKIGSHVQFCELVRARCCIVSLSHTTNGF